MEHAAHSDELRVGLPLRPRRDGRGRTPATHANTSTRASMSEHGKAAKEERCSRANERDRQSEQMQNQCIEADPAPETAPMQNACRTSRSVYRAGGGGVGVAAALASERSASSSVSSATLRLPAKQTEPGGTNHAGHDMHDEEKIARLSEAACVHFSTAKRSDEG